MNYKELVKGVEIWYPSIINEHFLKQIEWYYKLKDYGCNFISGEHELILNSHSMVIDLFGKKGDIIYIVEIGSIQNPKLQILENYAKTHKMFKFIHVKLEENHIRGD
jgi:hypothetical protein